MVADVANDTYFLIWQDEYLVSTEVAEQESMLPDIGQVVNTNLSEKSFRYIRNCSSSTDSIDLEDPRVIGSLVPLGIICLVVIFGNIMVIAAVRMTRKMRGATNLFIVSLAWADLTLGMVVLPFSAMFEVFGIWIFGRIWCSIWLAVDVWTCTASILHLVVISLDRYIAVTHPITYPNIMTSRRAKLLIAAAWVLSFVICFPPLVGWKEHNANDDPNQTLPDFVIGVSESDKLMVKETLDRCFPKCELIQEPGYVIYSAVGSFYAPMLVMMFFNWKIFRTATKTTKAIRQGWTKVKGAGDESMGMGVHRGGGAGSSTASGLSSRKTSTFSASMRQSNVIGGSPRKTSTASSGLRRHQTLTVDHATRTLPRSASSSSNCGRVMTNGGPKGSRRRNNSGEINREDDACLSIPLLNGSPSGRRGSASTGNLMVHPDHESGGSMGGAHRGRARSSQGLTRPHVSHHQPCPNHILGKTFAEQGTQTSKEDKIKGPAGAKRGRQTFRWRSKSVARPTRPVSPCSITRTPSDSQKGRRCCIAIRRWRWRRTRRRNSLGGDGDSDDANSPEASARCSGDDLSTGNPSSGVMRVGGNGNNRYLSSGNLQSANHHHHKFGKRNIKSQVRRFRMETKAAKTLGIIVGCFICCWFPFFTSYLITAFCEECIPPLAFSVIFWLGYCNSAINPFIYAMFSRDFRNAFKKILCKFLCNRQEPQGPGALARMGLPFAPQTVAIGLADRFPPTTIVTSAAGVVTAASTGSHIEHSSSNNNNGNGGRRGTNSLYP